MPQEKPYNSNSITQLDIYEHVRKRPGMYIGGRDERALHHLIWAGMDHMLEEAIVGYCDSIRIVIEDDNLITLENDGIGLPIANVTEIMTDFTMRESLVGHYYGIQGGLHGIGLSILNTLAETCQIEVRRDGNLWQQSYAIGLPTTDLTFIRQLKPYEKDGFRLTFKPDFTIFDANNFNVDIIASRCEDIAYLLPKVNITVDDRRKNGHCIRFHTLNGLSEWVQPKAFNPLHDVISGKCFMDVSHSRGYVYKVGIDFAFQFTKSTGVIERSFINTVPTPNGGSHIEGLHQSLLEVIFPASYHRPKWKDMNLGFVGAIHAFHPEPQWVDRWTLELNNPEVQPVVKVAVVQTLSDHRNVLQILRENSRGDVR